MAKQDRFDWAAHTEAVAADIFGACNEEMSRPPDDVRFCNHGSISINYTTGQFYDFENERGGGIKELIRVYKEIDDRDEAIAYAEECQQNFENGGKPSPNGGSASPNGGGHTKSGGFTAAEIALLDSQLPDIGGAIRGEPVTIDGNGWRVGSSTKISKNGRWFDFKVQQGGFGAASFITHYRACTLDEAVTWARSWLAKHPQVGPCGGADEDDGAGEDSADTLQRRAYIESTYAARLPIAGTPAATYLVGRGLDPAQLRPDIVAKMGWLSNHRGAEGALVFPYTDEAGGVLGLHLTYVTPTREKSPHEPARQTRRGPPDWRTTGRALLRLDFGTGPEMVVAEGFENALAVSLAGFARVVAVGAVGAYGRCRLPRTIESVVLAHDGDDPDAKPAAVQSYHRGVVRYLGQGLTLKMTTPPVGCDPNDVLRRGGPEALKKLLAEARCDLGKLDDTAFLDEVYKLDDVAYDRARTTALKLLGLGKLDTLDKLRAATRKRWAETPGSTEIPPVPDDDQLWLEPVTDIGPVLDAALAELARYVIAPLHRLATVVLWSAYVHLLQRADLGIDVAPRLGVRSKVPGCGKTTLLECVDNLTPKPALAGSITPSAIFRIIDETRATLLVDEADNVVSKNSNPDLLAILNSGHRRRTAYVIRSIPTPDGGWIPAKFNTFTGIAFAGLETLPETLQDRSIAFPLHKATREEKPTHLVNGYSPVLIACRRKFARWAADLTEFPAVPLPSALFNRTGDNWRGMFSIAKAAGGNWPSHALQTAMEAVSKEDSNRNVQLLEAIWQIFAEKKVVRIHTKVLLQALLGVEEAPWKTANRDREIDDYWLRENLKEFLPQPETPEEEKAFRASRHWREGNANPLKGYKEEHLREAWERYLGRKTPSETAKDANDAQDAKDAKAAGPTPAANDPATESNGAGASPSDQPPDPNGETGPATDGRDENAVDTPKEKSARNGPGPARRRTRSNETKPTGRA
jgi:hypothetical protein